ncbi:hypothetical protein ADK77_27375 [Streptomyces antibioticus]|nr:hypothetical protein [Streptomyces antibioticus]KOG62520.1 hypothetical protein ADK77_27375 [Streptomyces antibioticus]
MAHIDLRHIGHCRALLSRVAAVPGERPAPAAPGSTEPAGTQVWNQAESAVLMGYGPRPSSLL